VDLYSSHLLGLNRAAATLEVYRRDLEQFFAACEGRGLTPRGLTRMDLLNYLAELAQQGYQASTRARKTIAIRRFFQFLAEGEMLAPNPFATVPSPRLEHHERRVLSEPEYRALRELARQVSARAWAIVEILLQAGLRASELCGLRLGDVTFARPGHPGLILVRQGKGKKDRVVPLNSGAEQALRASLAGRDGLGPRSPLFVSERRGRPLSRQGLGSLLGRLYTRLGIAGASVHTLRHTFATHSLRRGVSLLVVKEVLGHSSLVSTERYLHLLRETMCAELEKHAL
jgi:site-specific recombinase XerD